MVLTEEMGMPPAVTAVEVVMAVASVWAAPVGRLPLVASLEPPVLLAAPAAMAATAVMGSRR